MSVTVSFVPSASAKNVDRSLNYSIEALKGAKSAEFATANSTLERFSRTKISRLRLRRSSFSAKVASMTNMRSLASNSSRFNSTAEDKIKFTSSTTRTSKESLKKVKKNSRMPRMKRRNSSSS
jgi:hypothetical protein